MKICPSGDNDIDSSVGFIKKYWKENSVEDLRKEWEDNQERKRKRWFERGNTIFAACVLMVIVGFIAYRCVFYFQNKQLEDTFSEYKLEMKDFYENSPDYNYLDAITPIGVKQEVGKTTYYYSAEDIKELGRGCDEDHMEYTIEEFTEFLENELSGAKLNLSEIFNDEDANYCIRYNDGRRLATFRTFYYARSFDLKIEIESDTATGKIHELEFTDSAATDRLYEILSKWLIKNGSDIFTVDYLKENIDIALATGSSIYKCEGGFLVHYYVSDNYVSICIMPEEMKRFYDLY